MSRPDGKPESRPEVVGRGRFRVDRRRALDKMERFQLEDPHRYVLELVAAAVCAGADGIVIENDSDDFVIRWRGDGPTRDELDQLLDFLFGQPEDRRGHMLQHLAIGVLGASGLKPRWLRVDVGEAETTAAWRLEVSDPTETAAVELDDPDLVGVRCHVREQLGADTIAEALALLFRDPIEARLVQGAAGWCPVPVLINGRPMPTRTPPSDGIARVEHSADGRAGVLWLLPPGVGGEPVDVLRYGVVVRKEPIAVGDYTVGGWFRDDRLLLNASRSAVVEDGAWTSFRAATEDAIGRLLVSAADAQVELRGQHLLSLARSAIPWLLARSRPLGPLGGVPLVVDVVGRPWSAADLAASPLPPGIVSENPPPGWLLEGWKRPLFGPEHRELLTAIVADTSDADGEVRAWAEGRARRYDAERRRRPPKFEDGRPQVPFVHGPCVGAVSLRSPPSAGEPRTIRVSVRVDGAEIETIPVPSTLGTLDAIVDSKAFRPDVTFRSVVRDGTFDQALVAVRQAASGFVAERVAHAFADDALPAERAAGLTLLTDLLRARKEDGLPALDAGLRAVKAVPTGDGRRISIDEILSAPTPWLVADAVPASCPLDVAVRLLVLPQPLHGVWTRLLAGQLVEGNDVLAEIERWRRVAGPRVPARLDPRPPVTVAVDLPGITGEIGVASPVAPGLLRVLKAGVAVNRIGSPASLPILVGIVDVADARVNRSHDALLDGEADAIRGRLLPAVDALAVAWWDRLVADGVWPLPDALVGWIADAWRRKAAVPTDRAIVRTTGGAEHGLADLTSREPRSRKLVVVSAPPPPVPGLEDVAVVTPRVRQLLEEIAPNRLRDGSKDIEGTTAAWRAFRARPVAPTPPALVEVVESGEGWTGRFLLPADPELVGQLRLEARYDGRVLATRVSSGRPGALGLVEGPAFLPDRTLSNVRDSKALTGLKERAEEVFPELVARALARAEAGDLGAPAVWRALYARLWANQASRTLAAEARRIARLPLLRRLDGQAASIEAVAAAAASKVPVALVASSFPAGPADHEWYLRTEPGVAEALRAALGRDVPDGAGALLDFRRGLERRRRLGRREPVLTEAIVKMPLSRDGVVGEVGLQVGQPGLDLTPLVDGVPLATWRLPHPLAAAAIFEAEGLRPDRAFENVVRDRRVEAIEGAIVAAARELAREVVRRAHVDRELLPLARRIAVDDLALGASEAPLFRTTSGWTSLAELRAREQVDGAVGFVAGGAALPGGPPPLVADDGVVALLGEHLTLVDLGPVVARFALGPPPATLLPGAPFVRAVEATPPRSGVVGWSERAPGRVLVATVVDGRTVVLGEVPADDAVPLGGLVVDPSLRPDGLWRGPVPGPELDALRRWVAEAGEIVAAGLVSGVGVAWPTSNWTEARRPVLRRLLTRRTADPDVLRAAIDGEATGLVADLVRLPLFVDSAGVAGSLLDVCAGKGIRVVSPGAKGRPAPGRPRFWPLEDAEREWLGRVRDLRAAAHEIVVEERGWQRREGPRHAKSTYGLATWLPVRAGDDVTGALGLKGLHEGGVAVLVAGVACGTIDAGVPGLYGWVEGPFATDPGFTEATVGDGTREEVGRVAARLLADEAERATDAAVTRLCAAVASFGGRYKPLLSLPGDPWSELAVFRDVAGRPVTVARLVEEVRDERRLLVARPRTPVPPEKLVVAAGTGTLDALARLFPNVTITRWEDVERETREKAERDGASRVERARRRVADAMTETLRRWQPATALSPAASAAIERYLVHAPAGWWEAAVLDPSGPVVLLATWHVAGELSAGPMDEIEIAARAARALAESARR